MRFCVKIFSMLLTSVDILETVKNILCICNYFSLFSPKQQPRFHACDLFVMIVKICEFTILMENSHQNKPTPIPLRSDDSYIRQ